MTTKTATKPEPAAAATTCNRSFYAADLRKALKACEIAISTEEKRYYYLNGICLELNAEDGSHLIATDGRRLVRWTLGTNGKNEQTRARVSISKKGVKALQKWLHKRKDYVTLSVALATGELFVSDGYADIITPELIDRTFPDYRRIIPNFKYSTPVAFSCNPKDLRRELELIAKGAKGRQGRNVVATFSGVPDSWLYLTGKYFRNTRVAYQWTMKAGKRKGETEIRWKDGENEVLEFKHDVCPGPIVGNVAVGFNVRYILDLLGTAKGPVKFQGADAGSPWSIEMPDGALRIIMPCRI